MGAHHSIISRRLGGRHHQPPTEALEHLLHVFYLCAAPPSIVSADILAVLGAGPGVWDDHAPSLLAVLDEVGFTQPDVLDFKTRLVHHLREKGDGSVAPLTAIQSTWAPMPDGRLVCVMRRHADDRDLQWAFGTGGTVVHLLYTTPFSLCNRAVLDTLHNQNLLPEILDGLTEAVSEVDLKHAVLDLVTQEGLLLQISHNRVQLHSATLLEDFPIPFAGFIDPWCIAAGSSRPPSSHVHQWASLLQTIDRPGGRERVHEALQNLPPWALFGTLHLPPDDTSVPRPSFTGEDQERRRLFSDAVFEARVEANGHRRALDEDAPPIIKEKESSSSAWLVPTDLGLDLLAGPIRYVCLVPRDTFLDLDLPMIVLLGDWHVARARCEWSCSPSHERRQCVAVQDRDHNSFLEYIDTRFGHLKPDLYIETWVSSSERKGPADAMEAEEGKGGPLVSTMQYVFPCIHPTRVACPLANVRVHTVDLRSTRRAGDRHDVELLFFFLLSDMKRKAQALATKWQEEGGFALDDILRSVFSLDAAKYFTDPFQLRYSRTSHELRKLDPALRHELLAIINANTPPALPSSLITTVKAWLNGTLPKMPSCIHQGPLEYVHTFFTAKMDLYAIARALKIRERRRPGESPRSKLGIMFFGDAHVGKIVHLLSNVYKAVELKTDADAGPGKTRCIVFHPDVALERAPAAIEYTSDPIEDLLEYGGSPEQRTKVLRVHVYGKGVGQPEDERAARLLALFDDWDLWDGEEGGEEVYRRLRTSLPDFGKKKLKGVAGPEAMVRDGRAGWRQVRVADRGSKKAWVFQIADKVKVRAFSFLNRHVLRQLCTPIEASPSLLDWMMHVWLTPLEARLYYLGLLGQDAMLATKVPGFVSQECARALFDRYRAELQGFLEPAVMFISPYRLTIMLDTIPSLPRWALVGAFAADSDPANVVFAQEASVTQRMKQEAYRARARVLVSELLLSDAA